VQSELVFARHAEAACNVAGVAGGEASCTGLTAAGWEQARELAARFAAEHRQHPFSALYSSPRLRVRQTASAVAVATGLAVEEVVDLAGPRYGEADGLPWDAVLDAFGALPRHRPHRPVAKGAEPWGAFQARAMDAVSGIAERHPGDRVLVICHGETIEAACLLFLGVPEAQQANVSFAVGHTGVTAWQHRSHRFGDRRWVLAVHNDVSHLSGSARPERDG
jgi:2,3-bisphosphoglycerate-dependent phosphoglycerate mutase